MISQWSFLNLPKPSHKASIYRIVSCRRFLTMLQNSQNTLVHPRKWDDPFENFILNSPVEVPAGRLARSQIRNNVYGQCWSLHREADLMWRAYSPEKNAIKLQTTVELLLQSLLEACGRFKDISCFIGRVRYLKKEAISRIFDSVNLIDPSGAGIAQTLLVKRYGFRSEREVRLIFLDHTHAAYDGLFTYYFDVNQSIRAAVLDPRMPDREVEQWTSRLRAAGYSGRLIQSALYRPPDFRTLRSRIRD